MQQRVKKIIEKLAKKYDITFNEAEFAVKAYYEKIKEVLEEGNFPEHETYKKIILPGFGRFTPNEYKIIKDAERRRDERIREQLLGELPNYKLTPEYNYLQGISVDRYGRKRENHQTVQHEQPKQIGSGDIRGIQDQTEI